uniref:ASPSCR1 tether for SLC2A4, UBX domain containing n=1 Tax=Sinocyclocheilus grahami TaxID=75366 RepID=A0A672KJZ2_SINGR
MAASSAAVSVLTPNGRRQTVKVSPNTPLLQVLEDVCKKHGFNPDEHGLKFQRLVLDLSLQWRFASLPNNAKLEMVVCSRPQTGAESAVCVCIESSRRTVVYPSCLTSSPLINHFLLDLSIKRERDIHFPFIRLQTHQRSSLSSCLAKTTLKSLGLTGGSAIIRYVLKGSGSSCPAASVDAVAMPTDDVAKTTVSQPPPEPPEEHAPVPMETPAPPTEVAAPPNHHPVKQEEEEPSSSREQGVWPKTDQPPQAKLMPQEDDERPGTSQQCHGSAPSATPTDFVPFSGSGQRLGGTAGLKMSTSLSSCVSGSPPKAKKPKPSHEIKRSVSAKQVTRDEEGPVDREPLVFHLDSGDHRHDDAELPDEFFEVTVDDIRKRFAQLKSERVFFCFLVVAPPKTILDEPNVTLFQVRPTVCYEIVLVPAICIPRTPPPVSEDDPPPAPESCDSSGQRGATEDGCDAQMPAVRPLKTDPGKVPKWLKLPGLKKIQYRTSLILMFLLNKAAFI